jgi:serine/threonine-protein kinase RsbW
MYCRNTMSETMLFSQAFSSDLHESASIQQQIMDIWLKNGVSDGDLPDLQLALEEGLANAVKHGNQLDPAKQVKVECQLLDDCMIRVTIEDEGAGFNPEEVPDPTDFENLDKPSGRGIVLMRAFMDEVLYNDEGNQLTFCKRCSINA